ncbi:hypothetical protein QF205_07370 [Luteimonas composti]|uniref:DUF3106 domain-containing protein n=1 Tax=Luteimonas composti TaxID=398257 RepID=A0ABT6MQJ1_9GAMM|nr:hypothetical protein [Luteimonas composti]MDH7452901.1 hypothetical protein [Luteimonas composti]
MSRREHDPLSPDERGMAQRLSRLESTAAPSPELDARILAMARGAGGAGATSRPAAPRRARPRWPVSIGLAASLAVAVGVAWQLRPQPDSQVLPAPAERGDIPAAVSSMPAAEEAPVAVVDAPEPPGSGGDTVRARPLAEGPPVAAAAPGETTPARQAAEREARAEAEARQARARGHAAEDAARRQARPAAAVAAPAQVAAAPPQRAVEPLRTRTTASQDEAIEFVPPPPPPAPPAPPAPAPAPAAASGDAARTKAPAPAVEQIVVTGTRAEEAAGFDVVADQPLDDRPPASADSPEVREHWLQRIRELREGGEVDAARASLREFMRRHPHAKVPADLRPLLDE